MCSAIKRPPVLVGSTFIHRRGMTLIKTVGEQRYFTRYTTGKAKPEVL